MLFQRSLRLLTILNAGNILPAFKYEGIGKWCGFLQKIGFEQIVVVNSYEMRYNKSVNEIKLMELL